MAAKTDNKLSPRLAMDGFVPNELLNSLIDEGRAARAGAILNTNDGRSYVLQDAVRVLGRVPNSRSGSDPFGFTGMVATLAELLDRGFVLSAQHIALGRSVYDVEHGALCQPLNDSPATPDDSGVNRALGF